MFLCLLLDKALTKTMSVTKSLHTETTKENYSASQTFMHFSVALKTVGRSLCISPLRTKKIENAIPWKKNIVMMIGIAAAHQPDLPWFQFLSPIFVCCVWLDHMRFGICGGQECIYSVHRATKILFNAKIITQWYANTSYWMGLKHQTWLRRLLLIVIDHPTKKWW